MTRMLRVQKKKSRRASPGIGANDIFNRLLEGFATSSFRQSLPAHELKIGMKTEGLKIKDEKRKMKFRGAFYLENVVTVP
jgi:hypothetical protein